MRTRQALTKIKLLTIVAGPEGVIQPGIITVTKANEKLCQLLLESKNAIPYREEKENAVKKPIETL